MTNKLPNLTRELASAICERVALDEVSKYGDLMEWARNRGLPLDLVRLVIDDLESAEKLHLVGTGAGIYVKWGKE